jgi:hypothetical protein
MHICKFSLLIKTADGIEMMKWERKYYTYTLLQIPNKVESIIVIPLEGVSVELSLITPFFLTDGKYIEL